MSDGDDAFFGRTPDLRKVAVPGRAEKELHDLVAEVERLVRRRDELIVKLLELGCSHRDIAASVGLTHGRIRQIGLEHGWPPADLAERRRRARDAAIERAHRWDA